MENFLDFNNIDKFENLGVENLTPIEIVLGIDADGKVEARKLYAYLGLNKSNYASWSKRNITENEFAEENIDYIPFVVNDERNPKPTTDYKLSASFAKKLAMGTHNDRGEAAKNYFIAVEDKLKKNFKQQSSIDPTQLSPELQMFNNIFNAVAAQQIENKKMLQQLEQTKEEVQNIRDVITLNPKAAWRRECNRILKAIGKAINNYSLPNTQVYDALKERAQCRPNVLITNLKKRALESGMCPSKVDNLNLLDVLENEPRLRDIYVNIVKEMAIKNNVSLKGVI